MNDLTYVLRGAALALAWFLVLNIAASALIARVAGPIVAHRGSGSPAFWFALRM
ncbi:MAG: hypothetical protein HY047_15570, partial [Acidobacteria bacterium]|nr:hypothetical protein [Acidobacteriota bacterium]